MFHGIPGGNPFRMHSPTKRILRTQDINLLGKTMIYLKNFRAARANLLRIFEVNHEKSMMIIFRATRANLLRICKENS